MTIIESIHSRKSCRTYDGRPIEPDQLNELRLFLAANRTTPFGSTVRFHLIDLDEMERKELKKLTTYGVIRGARHFIAGIVERGPAAMEDFGYCMEKNILQAASRGLGTCILGGTFRRSGFVEKMKLGEKELLPVISPVGYPRDRRSMVDRMFRTIAGSDNRKPWSELFYLHDTETVLDDEHAGDFHRVLQCVRLAPSASNKQPWRIIKKRDEDVFHFYLRRTPGYGNMVKDISLQNIDMGIAMCHFDLAARECGFEGEWRVDDPGIESTGMEYVASWAACNRGAD